MSSVRVNMNSTSTGIDLLEKNLPVILRKRRIKNVGVLCHPSSATRQFRHLVSIVEKHSTIAALFGPQHGIHGETQDNMIEWQDTRDEKGRNVFSLYGERRKPTQDSLKNVELMIVDLFDVGARYYTFIYTMAYMLEVCGELDIPVLICDRPNPLGGDFIEGNILDLNFKSFVGMYELPVCHGMTIAELAKFFCSKMKNPPELLISKMSKWKRKMHFPETKLPWTLPSPNMPNYEASVFYPGGCLLEATSLSEGRGTTRPFELIGAPFLNWDEIEKEYLSICKKLKLQPAIFHRQGFLPTFHKFSGEVCKGALQSCSNPKKFFPLRHTVILLWIFRKLYGSQWKWKEPPYEYEFKKLPIDILAGGTTLRETVDQQKPLSELFDSWKVDEAKFKKIRKEFLIYT
ncbi:MAG: DUF1343 domain-containing protein [Deltaproteobacteria bacterium]|nr:DUF1343 domain-containing protein [Deltaproteobacteria bacterium]